MQNDSYHKQIHDWSYWIPELYKIQQYDLYSNKNKKNGKTGLINVGNTCFMASGIQCLSHTEDLTKYFLSGMYEQELNVYSHFGSKGVISNAYYKLLNQLWNGTEDSINTNIFRIPFSKKTNYYRDNSQQDSQEMISILLDNLHEDLNRINKKPYFDMVAKLPEETDAQASQRWWECHRKRDDSIIVDLFHGQFKATLICPNCDQINITFDPFIFLTLSIPNEINTFKYKLFLIESTNCKEHTMIFFADTNVLFLKKKIVQNYPNILIDCLEIVTLNKDKTIKEIPNNSSTLHSLVQNYEEIICYEKKTKNSLLIYTYPIQKSMSTTFFLQSTLSISYLFYPWAYSLDLNCTLGDIWIETYKRIQTIIKLKENEIVELSILKKLKVPNISPFILHFSHQYTNKRCRFCDESLPLCDIFLRLNFETKYISLLDKNNPQSKIIFLASIPQKTPLKRLDINIEMPLSSKSVPSLITLKGDFQLQNCFELFRSEEKLSVENTWYCNKCNKHQEAFKKLEIYAAPNYLIIHFKRFKIRSNNAFMGFFNNNKNSAFINFPKENLDLSNYVIGPNTMSAQYDLYAVVNHAGGLNMGHYYAYCKNQNTWICYNDGKVFGIDESEVVTSNAYLLFYKKKVMDSF